MKSCRGNYTFFLETSPNAVMESCTFRSRKIHSSASTRNTSRQESYLTDELSVNKLAWRLTQELVENSALHGVKAERTTQGTMLIDAGIRAKGGFQAGQLITEICMGGLGKARISSRKYDGSPLQSIFVWTDHPAIATLCCQLAGWRLKEGSYSAIGSGPARALALKPAGVYEVMKHKDTSDK